MDNSFQKILLQWLFTFTISVLACLLIQHYIVRTIAISGSSMTPTFEHGDRAMLSLQAYCFKEPKIGDIIAFSKENGQYIKRIIGLPGDKIGLIHKRFTVNGKLLDDAFSDELFNPDGDIRYPLIVPDGCYFVLGDNRSASADSRYKAIGCVSKQEIIGKVILKMWRTNARGLVDPNQMEVVEPDETEGIPDAPLFYELEVGD